jgi:hypothetical protein
VKPSNVLVDLKAADHVYLSDFGLTRRLGDDGPPRAQSSSARRTTSRPSRSRPRLGGRRTRTARLPYECPRDPRTAAARLRGALPTDEEPSSPTPSGPNSTRDRYGRRDRAGQRLSPGGT